ncbi:MAG: competence/damage-inducible protein A, partial [Candidatus Latescibacterota bacterium]
MRAEVITVGDELITGLVVDSNSAYLGRRLTELGFRVVRMTSVGDGPEEIRIALQQVSSDVAVVTGGLGPTPDDRTKEVFAEVVGRRLVLDEEVLEGIRKRFAHRGMEMPRSNVRQATVPEGSQVLPNRWGTAPGLHVKADGRHFFLLPGVPREMRGIFEESVVPILRKLSGRAINFVLLRTTGISESALCEKLSDLDLDKVAFLPGLEGVDVRVMWEEGEDPTQLIEEIRRRAGQFVYAEGEERMEEVVGRLLKRRGWRIATAESCTGGLVGHRITEVPGSSDYFERGVVAYSNRAKVELLGVPEELIRRHGAVSPQVAKAMAEGVRERTGV